MKWSSLVARALKSRAWWPCYCWQNTSLIAPYSLIIPWYAAVKRRQKSVLGLVRNTAVVVLRLFSVLGNCCLFVFKAALLMSSETKYLFCPVASFFSIKLMQIQSNCLEADELIPHLFSFSFPQLFYRWCSLHLHLKFCWTVKLPPFKCEHCLSSSVWLINFVVIKHADKEELPVKIQFASCVLTEDYYNIRTKGFSWQYSRVVVLVLVLVLGHQWVTNLKFCSAKFHYSFFPQILWRNSSNFAWVCWMAVSHNQTATAGKK